MNPRTTGLVLAGAVAMGAFEAGAVAILARRRVALRRITGTSAGALSAVVLAAGVATGRVGLAARIIEDTWRDHAAWHDAVQLSPAALFHLQGVGSVERMRTSLLDAIERVLYPADPSDERGEQEPYPGIEFRVIGTDLLSVPTTHERAFTFRGFDFWDAEERARIALSTVASAAFPGLYAPVAVEDRLFADGGVTNNSPLSYLIEPAEVDRAIVVSTAASRVSERRDPPEGVALASELIEILINERLARDVRAAERANARLARVESALGGFDEHQRGDVIRALGLRRVTVVQIRPLDALEGTPFSGLGSARLRADYIAIGKERATEVLDGEDERAARVAEMPRERVT